MPNLKHFKKIADGFDVVPGLHELMQTPPVDFIRAEQVEAKYDIDIKGRPAAPPGYRFLHEAQIGPAISRLFREAADHVLKRHFKSSGMHVFPPRVMACPPKGYIRPHRDNLGSSFERYFFRFQLALQCDEHAVFRIGRERACFKPGELWLCDIGDRVHEMRNDSDQWRVVFRFDASPY